MGIFGMNTEYEENLEIRANRLKYKNELKEHAEAYNQVFNACLDKIKNLVSEEDLIRLHKGLEEHDVSKYSLDEFEAYRKHKYPAADEPRDDEQYELALLHHHHINNHHWQHWVLIEDKGKPKALRIPFVYVIECALDIVTEGYQENRFGTSIYEEEKDKIFMHPESRKELVDLIKYFEEGLI